MTKAQKAALRFAYDLLRGQFKNQTLPGIHVITPLDEFNTSGVWLEPDRDLDRPFLNEAICSELVLRGLLECRRFPPHSLWLYRITPEGCTAIGKTYPGTPPTPQPPLKRMHQNRHIEPPDRPDNRDPHRFRRSSDWRRQ
ncbi:MAG TPA: hypothetical protein VHL11_09190 [Phototrophicaceae bacterium]|jgi:hypothetical protein|nr:hypothetical protein [Phototrophicaceae bacterium]